MAKKRETPGEPPPEDNTVNPENSESVIESEDVLTYEDLEKENLNKPEDKPKPKAKKKQTGKILFELPYAPMGESKTVITFKMGTELMKMEIPLFNKLYEYPENLSKKESEVLRKALKDNGFIDVSRLDAGTTFDQVEKKYTYSAVHPEHTDRNPINGTISLAMVNEAGLPVSDAEGKQISKQVTIENGIVKTDDKLIYDALLKAGFRSGYKTERKE